eukprot:2842020-Pleurochrysis_carterae.AAC.1
MLTGFSQRVPRLIGFIQLLEALGIACVQTKFHRHTARDVRAKNAAARQASGLLSTGATRTSSVRVVLQRKFSPGALQVGLGATGVDTKQVVILAVGPSPAAWRRASTLWTASKEALKVEAHPCESVRMHRAHGKRSAEPDSSTTSN